ncbi:MAG: AI-2E family transporter [Burkholderiaceae bacterium]|jgi:predicted PurR-regulated permease PerM|nr:AI-2E family transporter [Burkholderiaceae bacterium]
MTERSLSTMHGRFDLIFRIVAAAVIVVGIFLVLMPFLSALLVAGVLAIATWPLYQRIHTGLAGRSTWAATLMLLLILVLVVIPISLLAGAAADQLPTLVGVVKGWVSGGVHVPEQLKSIPLVGDKVYEQLAQLTTDRAQMGALLQKALEPAGKLSVAFVRVLGDGILQLLLVAFIAFFYYRDGHRIAEVIQRIAGRLSGEMSTEMLHIVVGTTRSVFIGLVGTAAAQGLVAFIGFLIAGVPAAFLLSVGTFVLSVVPMGPVLLWGGAAVWLYLHGETGWAIFMVVWGAVVISSIDNFLKPLLIARGSTLSLGLIFLGVLGGVFAFGFIGVILGPVLLALGVALGRAWIAAKDPGIALAAGIAAPAAASSAVASGSTPTRS